MYTVQYLVCAVASVQIGSSLAPLSCVVHMYVCTYDCRCLVWAILPSSSLSLSRAVLGYWDSRTMSPAHGTS